MVLGPAVLTIGRLPDNQLILNDSQVSGHHAEIRQQGQGYTITDTESRNHTFVNGQQLLARVPRLLTTGDMIRIGQTTLTYVAASPFTEVAPQPQPRPQPQPQPQPQPPLEPKPPRLNVGAIVAIILVAVLLLVGVIAIPVAIISGQTSATNAAATATATAHQNLYNSATSGNLAFNDPLSSNNNGWSQGNTVTGSSCQFTNGAYYVSEALPTSLYQCHATNAPTFSNFAYQIQMTIVSGDEGCVVFRYSEASGKYYAFCIGSHGSYKFVRIDPNDNHYAVPRAGSSSAITTSLNQRNTVTVIARGAELYMYVNGQLVVMVNDTTYTQGLIGVGALDDTNLTEVAFSNVQVWTLS